LVSSKEGGKMQSLRNEWTFARQGLPAAVFLLGGIVLGAGAIAATAEPDKEALIREALGAAPPAVASTAAVKTMDGKVLKQGEGTYTCFPTPPSVQAKGGREPMCLDKIWLAWADAWMNKKPFKASGTGIGYMLAGDTGASNIDPYAQGPAADNQWVVEGPHIMVIVADPAQLEGFPTDPNSGGAYVMWKGTPYVHVMVPVAPRPAARQ
jgi:hypothetical protein